MRCSGVILIWKFRVERHAGSIAANDYNLKLSQHWVAAVSNALVSRYA